MTDTSPSSSRAAERDSLLLKAELLAEDSGRPIGTARIRNLSATGLMADCDARLADGTRILFTLRGVGEVRAIVSWCREGRIGLAFDQPIDPKAARKPVGAGNQTVATTYTGANLAPPISRYSRPR